MSLILELIYLIFYMVYCYIESFVRIFLPGKKKNFAEKLVLVTGSGHGIGRELALQFSGLGARLVLWDINKENNEQVAAEIRENGGEVYTYVCDVSKLESIKDVASKTKHEIGEIDVLVNNAGVLNGGALLQLKESDIRRTIEINLMAYIWTCREFLPSMIKNNKGHIINIASMAAKGGVAYLTDYSASKHAVWGFTEALTDEMRREGHNGINFTTVFPMFVDTGMTRHARARVGEMLTPENVAAAVVAGAQQNHATVYIPPGMDLQMRLSGLLPRKVVKKIHETLDFGIDPQYGEKLD